MNFKNTILLLSIAISFSACQSDSKSQKNELSEKPYINKKLEYTTFNTSPKPQNKIAKKTTAQSLGITVNNGVIIIDTKQTKNFFQDIGKQVSDELGKIENSLRNNKIKSNDETGIIVTKDKLHIDINKTRNFMQRWINSMENVAKEIDKTVNDIEKSFPSN